MQIIELDRTGGLLGKLIREARAQEPPRTGLHVSTIIDDLCRTLHPERYSSDITPDQMFAFQEVGNVIEDILSEGLRQRHAGQWCKPEPRHVEGIWLSPDGHLSGSTHDEFKATWTSSKDGLANPKLKKYEYQVLAYLYGWGILRARIHVLFVNGDYKPPRPLFRTFILKPTYREVKANWHMLKQHARDRGWLI